MKPNYTISEFNSATPTSQLSCICYNCNVSFNVMKKNITQEIKQNRGRIKFCSKKCKDLYRSTLVSTHCSNCNININKRILFIKQSKSGNHFCSKSCAATYNNTHKTIGNRRSKLENYLEVQLRSLYPNLEILFNDKNIINSELDIYIPSLKLAFELNGIFHYESIYGKIKLSQIQNNDNRKFQACLEQGIELCIIDTSQQKYFKELTSKKYLDVIITIINNKSMNIC